MDSNSTNDAAKKSSAADSHPESEVRVKATPAVTPTSPCDVVTTTELARTLHRLESDLARIRSGLIEVCGLAREAAYAFDFDSERDAELAEKWFQLIAAAAVPVHSKIEAMGSEIEETRTRVTRIGVSK